MSNETIERVAEWGRWNVLWFRVTLPFYRAYNAMRRAVIAARGHVSLVTHEELCAVTEKLDEHPEGWDHPCACAECRSYADG